MQCEEFNHHFAINLSKAGVRTRQYNHALIGMGMHSGTCNNCCWYKLCMLEHRNVQNSSIVVLTILATIYREKSLVV